MALDRSAHHSLMMCLYVGYDTAVIVRAEHMFNSDLQVGISPVAALGLFGQLLARLGLSVHIHVVFAVLFRPARILNFLATLHGLVCPTLEHFILLDRRIFFACFVIARAGAIKTYKIWPPRAI